VQKPYVEAQGINRRDEAIAQGMSAVFNSQSSMLSSALSGADSMAQNSNSTLQAIIRTSTAA
jgi:hypothetical protein